jgi:hypothetical protein
MAEVKLSFRQCLIYLLYRIVETMSKDNELSGRMKKPISSLEDSRQEHLKHRAIVVRKQGKCCPHDAGLQHGIMWGSQWIPQEEEPLGQCNIFKLSQTVPPPSDKLCVI